MVDFSVIICTYNGASRIPEVLERLRSQQQTDGFSWEVWVVDNNSTDDTAAVVKRYQSDWISGVPLRYCFEPRQGLAYARRRGAQNAQGQVLAFLDDDNLPYADWLAEIASFSCDRPQAGAFGGQIYGKFDVPPPQNFGRIARFFALIQGDVPYCYNEKYAHSSFKMFPPGAGIVVRKQAWQTSIKGDPVLPQTGEDLEMLLRIWQAGWEIWFVPNIKIEHHIPATRFHLEYLTHFFHQNGLIRYRYRMLQYPHWQKPFLIPLYLLNDLKKLILFTLSRWRKNTDLIDYCERQLLLSTLLSPLHYWVALLKSLHSQMRTTLSRAVSYSRRGMFVNGSR